MYYPLAERIRRTFTRFGRDRRGIVNTLLAFSMPVLIGALALGVETGLTFVEKRQLQTQVDAAAVAAAYEIAKENRQAITATATREANRNGLKATHSPVIIVSSAPMAGAYVGKSRAVEVTIKIQQPALFSAIFQNEAVPITARAVAEVRLTANACVLAMSASSPKAARILGTASINLEDCALASNSDAVNAISLEGSAAIKAETLWTAGQMNRENNVSLELKKAAVTEAWAIKDPYADLTIPALNTCDANSLTVGGGKAGTTVTLNPGIYCNSLTFEGKNTVKLNPGTYYINGGDLQIKGQVKVKCNCFSPTDGVTFVLTNTSDPTKTGTVYIAGGASVNLRAPTSNLFKYPGVLIHQDPRVTELGPAAIEGGSGIHLTGALHFPSQALRFAGNNTTESVRCLIVIGKTVEFTGTTNLVNSDCKAAGIKTVSLEGVFLVE